MATLKEIIELHSNDALAKREGMVYQVWEDGEVTLQKSGSLLGQRNLHCIEMGFAKGVDPARMPHQNASGHGFAYVSEAGALAIRVGIAQELELRVAYLRNAAGEVTHVFGGAA